MDASRAGMTATIFMKANLITDEEARATDETNHEGHKAERLNRLAFRISFVNFVSFMIDGVLAFLSRRKRIQQKAMGQQR